MQSTFRSAAMRPGVGLSQLDECVRTSSDLTVGFHTYSRHASMSVSAQMTPVRPLIAF